MGALKQLDRFLMNFNFEVYSTFNVPGRTVSQFTHVAK
jgi:hypothetical protein